MSEETTYGLCGGYVPPQLVIEAVERVTGFIVWGAKIAAAKFVSLLLALPLLAILVWLLLSHPVAVLLGAWYFWLPVIALENVALAWAMFWKLRLQ